MHRHKYVGRKFGREKGPREALIKNLATSLILHERIETTLAKAKEIRPVVEKIITKGKKGDLAARRQLLKKLPENAAAKVIEKLSVEYKETPGGYTRILKTGFRGGDGAPTAIIEFTGAEVAIKEEKKAREAKKEARKVKKETKEKKPAAKKKEIAKKLKGASK
ncbi:MAG: 50S ribosomal protein L17 [candidate division CPR2 bacterium GW2011_GWC1_39_9]|uniref:Large ribosomal subunit protein bL17 n=1 Tax=candidate division CPR2 bacterium GW2011_GWC2_39_10 TaxID=1618345 RepID=A0A0G0P936_UNCC2|nr:MAG: 50S ribosomal protein L17 [candidate division CPR2 bacterium GW2011_GWC2_39_10]KKR33769.1 MAG: 50S ribosomal protein L17 [candidate division CPR2 bacterium GW2011_GWC1_39_9]